MNNIGWPREKCGTIDGPGTAAKNHQASECVCRMPDPLVDGRERAADSEVTSMRTRLRFVLTWLSVAGCQVEPIYQTLKRIPCRPMSAGDGSPLGSQTLAA